MSKVRRAAWSRALGRYARRFARAMMLVAAGIGPAPPPPPPPEPAAIELRVDDENGADED